MEKCEHCGSVVEHPGVCPTIKAIEYYEFHGGIKRVEYKCAADYALPFNGFVGGGSQPPNAPVWAPHPVVSYSGG